MDDNRKVHSPPSSGTAQQPLTLDLAASYECPVCRHGQLQAMALMETFACSFCRQILEANLDQQTVHLVAGTQPMGWRWLGQRWQPLHQGRADITLALWLMGGLLMVLPAGMVALGAYMFPPLDATTGLNWTLVWALGTFLTHSTIVGWLVAEYYQFPVYVMAKIRWQRWQERLSS
jgi:hypothetical protein